MQLKVEIKRLKELLAAFETAPKATKDAMRKALKQSLIAVQRRARREHSFRSRTTALEDSINYEIVSQWPPVGRVWLDNSAGVVSSDKFRLTADTSYGVFVHEGTRPHGIAPVKKKALRWQSGDGRFNFFAKHVWHPGTKPDPFIYKAAENETANINDIFDRHINKALGELSRWKGRI